MYNYNHLYYFFIAAQFGSITKASEHLKISQPALSSQIKALEDSIGVPLFIRNGRNIELTPKGKIIYSYCSKMFKEMDGLSKFLNSTGDGVGEILKIAVSDQVERPFIAEIIGKFIKKYKADNLPKIILNTEPHDLLIGDFKLGQYDLLITHTNESLSKSRVTVLDLPVAIVGNSKFLYKEGKSFKNISSLLKNNQMGFVMPTDRFKLREEINLFLSKEKYKPEIIIESNILSANIRVLTEGIGIAFLPIAYVKKEIKKGTISSFAPSLGFWNHQLFLATNPNVETKRGIEEFKMLFIEEININ